MDEEIAAAVAGDHLDVDESDVDVEAFPTGVNDTFAVDAPGGRYALKFGTFDPQAVRVEPHLLRLLAEHDVPVPNVVAIGTQEATPYFLMAHLDGAEIGYPQEFDADLLAEVAPVVGEALARVQAVPFEPGRPRLRDGELIARGEGWESVCRELLNTFARQAKGNYPGLGRRATELAHWTPIPSVEEPVLCPVDLHTANVFLDDDDDLAGVIDFERMFGGHPGAGRAITLHTMTADRPGTVTERVADRLDAGYRRVDDVPADHPAFDLLAVAREMRAAHIWWEDPDAHHDRLEARLDDIEARIETLTD